MPDLRRVNNILGGGTLARQFIPSIRLAGDELGASRMFLTNGFIELNRSTYFERKGLDREGVIDVSPSPEDIKNAIGNAGSDEIAESNRENWEPLAQRMVDRIVQAHVDLRLEDGATLWTQGLLTGHRLPAGQVLRSLKKRIPKQFINVYSTLPDNFDKRDRLRDGYDLFHRLKAEGVIDTTFLTDNLSPFARRFSLAEQDRYVAKTLASLLAAQLHFTKNPSIAEIGRSLGDYAALVGMAFSSRSLVVAKEVAGWNLLRRTVGLPTRGFGHLGNLVIEAKLGTEAALGEPEARAIEEAIDLRMPFVAVYTVPLRPSDKRWITFSNEIRTWLMNYYPTATPVFVSGNGTPDSRFVGSYWLQVSILFPMPDVPAPLKAILESESLRRRNNVESLKASKKTKYGRS